MVQVKFYYRPGCGLCHEIEGTLMAYAAQYAAQVTRVNIDEDRAAHQRYWDKIPVIEIVGHSILMEPITPAALKAALHSADKAHERDADATMSA
jgi:thiol-disulfide isomerase/thioredoxin